MMRWKTTPARLDRRQHATQSRAGQDHGCGGFGHIRRVGYGYPGFSLTQRGSIVDAVPAHSDHLATTLKAADQPELVFRKHAGEDTAVESHRRTGLREAFRVSKRLPEIPTCWPHCGRDGIVTRDHNGADAGVADRTHDGFGIFAHGVLQPQQPTEAHLRRSFLRPLRAHVARVSR